jgi:hypothetical protein
LHKKDKQGVSTFEHLKQRGIVEIIELPSQIAYLINYFHALSRRRTSNGFSPCPISFTEIQAWAFLYHIELEDWELDIILALDDAWLKFATEDKK